MTTMHEVEFAYDIGEEVVFRLGPATTAGATWSIGEIVERIISSGHPRYTNRFRDADALRTVAVAENAIDGTA
jgi:hypothetical protein